MGIEAFAAALAEWTPGGVAIERDAYRIRLETCEACRWRSGLICSARDCGCRLTAFALDSANECPTGRWPASASETCG
jgi:hypothetical protein